MYERVLAHLQTECSNEVELVCHPQRPKLMQMLIVETLGGFDTYLVVCLLMMNGANVVQAYAALLLLLIDFPC